MMQILIYRLSIVCLHKALDKSFFRKKYLRNNNSAQVIMKTITIEIKNEIALKFLHNLESLHLIRLVESKTISKKQKLSERFAGCLTAERADELQTELIQMRKEWERNSY
jgi:hypothetical protein